MDCTDNLTCGQQHVGHGGVHNRHRAAAVPHPGHQQVPASGRLRPGECTRTIARRPITSGRTLHLHLLQMITLALTVGVVVQYWDLRASGEDESERVRVVWLWF